MDGFVPAHFLGWYIKVSLESFKYGWTLFVYRLTCSEGISLYSYTHTEWALLHSNCNLLNFFHWYFTDLHSLKLASHSLYLHYFSPFFPQTLMIRDWWMCMIISVMFEFLEYSLEHQLPNFSECWWDHVCLNLFCSFSRFLHKCIVKKTHLSKPVNLF